MPFLPSNCWINVQPLGFSFKYTCVGEGRKIDGYIKVIRIGAIQIGSWIDKNDLTKNELSKIQTVR